MPVIHNLGYPRIGPRRELKFALERYFRGESSEADLARVSEALCASRWQEQRDLDWVPVGEFSLYDHVLDTSALVGNLPARACREGSSAHEVMFRAARGRAPRDPADETVAASEMTKWFDTNYHYLVPEFSRDTTFRLEETRLLQEFARARALGVSAKPVLLGPVSYLWLGKSKDDSDRLELLPRLLPVYEALFQSLARAGATWVQVDEPVLVMDAGARWQEALRSSYAALGKAPCKKLLTTYFGPLSENSNMAIELPVDGLHLDAVRAQAEAEALAKRLPQGKVLSLGVVDGRNVWKNDSSATLDWLEPLYATLGERLWLAPSCSLLHVPLSVAAESALDPELRSWLAFAREKLDELSVLRIALERGRAAVEAPLALNRQSLAQRASSPRVQNPAVRRRLEQAKRCPPAPRGAYAERLRAQTARLALPPWPTTTIGSFPQTDEVRALRTRLKRGELDPASYAAGIRQQVRLAVERQEEVGLDVLVHGEAERNDMVEFFGERLSGYAFTQLGWVQSYGSRCVKPPILYGDVERREPMTVELARYAQSLTKKPMKGMLTGPVTMLNWSFVRDDQPRSESALQLAFALRDEVADLEAAGIGIIQIDEAALREGLPLRRADWSEYLRWAIECFRITAGTVRDETQIHTHMCYSEFNDIIRAIAEMDADVITIETSRSDMELLAAFRDYRYPNQIGPGIYDIHSPNVPTVEQMVSRLRLAAARVPKERLWVNPDCGLKTRRWEEVLPALRNMVSAARQLRLH